MRWPYTPDYLGAFIAAQAGAALLLTALLLFLRPPALSRMALLAGIWVAALALLAAPTLESYDVKPAPHLFRNLLVFAAVMGALGALTARRLGIFIVALTVLVPLWLVTAYLQDSEGELSALYLSWLGLLIGLLARGSSPRTSEAADQAPEGSYAVHDTMVFAAATLLASLVCVYVMDRREGSADEWAYTYQAALLAKGRIYAEGTRCGNYLQNFYVYEHNGRLFSQYPPGWPFFIVPFVWLRAVWLSGPFSMGLMVLGVTRLARSAMRGFGSNDARPRPSVIRAAGTWAGTLAMLGTIVLVNGGSRYAHVYVLALYAWSLEALLQVATPGLPRRGQVLWGVVLGCASSLMLAARPADGAFVGVGIAVVFLYSVARRRIGWRGVAAAAGGFAFWGGLTLVILRVQLGTWFTTGYSLLATYHTWGVVKYSTPSASEWKFAVPLAVGAYCWWPCSMGLGLAGLVMMRGRSRALVVAFATGCLPFLVYCAFLEYARADWGYGPRYELVIYVPMAVGGGVALAEMMVAARARVLGGQSALARGGPAALVLVGVAATWLRLLPLVWPPVHEFTRRHGGLSRAIEEAHLKNAVVIAAEGTTGFADMDLTTNLPINLYPDQDVIIGIDRESRTESTRCLRDMFPGRRFYYASGGGDVHIKPAP